MFSLTNHIIIDAPAEAVWEVVARRFDRIGEWATAIPSSTGLSAVAPETPPAAGAPVPGRVCRTGIALVPEATEIIVDYDEAGHHLTYQATRGLPRFIRLARNRWQVTPLGPQRCRVEFQARLEVRGVLGRVTRWWLLTRVGRTGGYLLEDLRHYVEHGVASPRKQRQLSGQAESVGNTTPSTLLRGPLAANAGFSAATGLFLITGAVPLSGWLGVPGWLGVVVGLGLLLFAFEVARTARHPRPTAVRQVITADTAWVVAAAVVIIGFPQSMSTAGLWALGVVTAAVADFAALQTLGLRRWQGSSRPR
jgi:Polyketide cyclase / dehydrase and lipid transport